MVVELKFFVFWLKILVLLPYDRMRLYRVPPNIGACAFKWEFTVNTKWWYRSEGYIFEHRWTNLIIWTPNLSICTELFVFDRLDLTRSPMTCESFKKFRKRIEFISKNLSGLEAFATSSGQHFFQTGHDHTGPKSLKTLKNFF